MCAGTHATPHARAFRVLHRSHSIYPINVPIFISTFHIFRERPSRAHRLVQRHLPASSAMQNELKAVN